MPIPAFIFQVELESVRVLVLLVNLACFVSSFTTASGKVRVPTYKGVCNIHSLKSALFWQNLKHLRLPHYLSLGISNSSFSIGSIH